MILIAALVRTIRKNPAASLSSSSSSSCSIAFLPGQNEDDDDHEHDQEKSRRFFIILVLVVVLDCFPRRAERGRGRREALQLLEGSNLWPEVAKKA